MRIDLNQLSFGNVGREVNGKKPAGKASGPVGPEDKASFSTDTLDVPTLEAQVLASPEVRQDKVGALREAIQNGQYKVEPEKIAQAILLHNRR